MFLTLLSISINVSSPSHLTTKSKPILRVPSGSPVGCGPPAINKTLSLYLSRKDLTKSLISHN